MRTLHDPISAGVVRQNPNMRDPVPFSEVVERLDEGRAVVRDDFLECAPPAKDLFENERTNRPGRLSPDWTHFRVRRERAPGVDDAAVSLRLWHEDGVDVRLSEK